MEFISLSQNPNYPCNIIKFKSINIMLDCSLDLSTLMAFLPLPLVQSDHFNSLATYNPPNTVAGQFLDSEIKECGKSLFVDSTPEFGVPQFSNININQIDVILISNYRSILALPFITECEEFSGFVYATLPSLNYGRIFMEEIVTNIQRNPKLKYATNWKKENIFRYLPLNLFPKSVSIKDLKNIYTLEAINSCFSKVKPVAFSEKINIFNSLTMYPVSSGYSIGSANWVIESNHEKIVNISSSSTYTTHARTMENMSLKNANLVILTSLSLVPGINPNNRLNEFCEHIENTLKVGGNVLLPCYSSGQIYDLFECLLPHLEAQSLGGIPIYFISPIADHSLAYSNIMGEWLSDSKQNRVFIPEEPFPHAYFVKTGRIKHFSSISEASFNNEFTIPCVVFTGHPSLRFGDVVHFIELWGHSANNLILLTEPEFSYEALAPYQPLAMKVVSCPIDPRLGFLQANKILRDLKPANLLLPTQYTIPINGNDSSMDTVIQADCELFTYKECSKIFLPIRSQFEKVTIDSKLISSLKVYTLQNNDKVTTITGMLELTNNKYRLLALTEKCRKIFQNDNPIKTLPRNKNHVGEIKLHSLSNVLRKGGYNDLVFSVLHGEYIFQCTIKSIGAMVEVDNINKEIKIFTQTSNDENRLKLVEILEDCLFQI